MLLRPFGLRMEARASTGPAGVPRRLAYLEMPSGPLYYRAGQQAIAGAKAVEEAPRSSPARRQEDLADRATAATDCQTVRITEGRPGSVCPVAGKDARLPKPAPAGYFNHGRYPE